MKHPEEIYKNNKNPLESAIEKKVCDYAKSKSCVCYKFVSPSRRSVPDRLIIMPEGKGVFFIEFKRKGAKTTISQDVEIAKIRKQGMHVSIIDNVAGGKLLVDAQLLSESPWNQKKKPNEKKSRERFDFLTRGDAGEKVGMDDPMFN